MLLSGFYRLATHASAAVLPLLTLLCGIGWGQTVEARVSSMRGTVFSSDSVHQLHALSEGEILAPGTEIDTRRGGLLTIGLSDGSSVIVEPGSRIILKDYNFASSARDLFDILLGRVRVKINHLGGRPNPYRINSPTASIAVRGTEFSLAVDDPGDTRVVVYEGIVEVTSLTRPDQRTLVKPGRGVIVRPNQDILYFTPVAGREVAARESGDGNDQNQQNGQHASGERSGGDDNSPRNSAGSYQRSIAGLAQAGQMPFLLRFTAFADAYLDSLENPAYGTEFSALEGRIVVSPSFMGSQSLGATSTDFASAHGRPTDYSVSPQFSFFVPLPGGKTVVGSSLAASRTGLQSAALVEGTSLSGSVFAPGSFGTRSTSESTRNSFLASSFVVAHQFGETGATSIGFGIDRVSGWGSLLSTTTQTAESLASSERTQSNSRFGQTQFKVGVTHNLIGGHQLGLFYRYGLVSASEADRSRLLNNVPQALESSSTAGDSSEVGIRLRGPLTDRWFYGLVASSYGLHLGDSLHRPSSVDSHQHDNILRSALGFGLGYAIRPRIVVSFDLAAGIDRTSYRRNEDSTGNLLENLRQSSRFVSAQAAIQADIWRKLFVTASLLVLHQSVTNDTALFPDRFGRTLSSNDLFLPAGLAYGRPLSYYSEFGLGRRFNSGVLAQYVVSTDYGITSPRHTLLLEFTFRPHER